MEPPPLFAICLFQTLGFLRLQQNGPVLPLNITGNLTNLTVGKHGIHVHEFGNILSCNLTGGHFNPWNHKHGAPEDEIRHAGDLGNIEADIDGTATVNLLIPKLSLYYPTIIGRSIVVHQNEDDLGKNNNSASQSSGNSGPRIDCCIIALTASQT